MNNIDRVKRLAEVLAQADWIAQQPDEIACDLLPVVGEIVREQLRRVEALHSPIDHGTGPQCQGCATGVTFTRWPCKTIAALRADR